MKYFDPVRRKNICASPEETVRQHIIQWLLETKKVPRHAIETELSLANLERGNKNRIDLMVHHFRKGKSISEPWLLVECKCSEKNSWALLEVQINKYLRVLRPQYIMLGLGNDWRFLEQTQDKKSYALTQDIPEYPHLD